MFQEGHNYLFGHALSNMAYFFFSSIHAAAQHLVTVEGLCQLTFREIVSAICCIATHERISALHCCV